MKKILKYLLYPFYKRYKTIKLLFYDYKYLINYYGAFGVYFNQKKFKAHIIILSHVIEKGLSLKDVKPNFGVPKIIILLNSLDIYYNQYQDQQLLVFVLSIIKEYISFNKKLGIENEKIISKYKKLSDKIIDNNEFNDLYGGTIDIAKNDILKFSDIDYMNFCKSRHSIRIFTGECIDINLIEKSLKIAELTPSACNRQPWKNYVFTNKSDIIRILDIQTGARQFKEEIGALFILTSSAEHFFGNEHNQLFVNGGMYAMNLILALHSCGLGTIPLNMGVSNKKINEIRDYCKIPKGEVPIMIIASGIIPEKLKVASSRRFSYKDYTKIY